MSTLPTFTTTERAAWRAAASHLRAAIVADQPAIRAEKLAARAAQRTAATDCGALQADLHRHSARSRSRHLLYGGLRGRPLERTAPGYAPTADDERVMLDVWAGLCTALRSADLVPPAIPPVAAAALANLRAGHLRLSDWCRSAGRPAPEPPALLTSIDDA